MPTYFKTLTFFLVCFASGFSQTEVAIDSMKKLLSSVKDPVDKLQLYNQLSMAYIDKDVNLSKQYNDSLELLSKKVNDKDMRMRSIYNQAVVARVEGKYSEAIPLQEAYLDYAEKSTDTIKQVESLYQLGVIYYRTDANEKAINYLLRALKLSEAIAFDSQTSKIVNVIGVIHSALQQYEKAIVFFDRAIEIDKRLQNYSTLSIVLNGKGIAYRRLENEDKALENFQESLKYAELADNKMVQAAQYRNIGIIFKDKGEFLKAESQLKKALSMREIIGQKMTIGGSFHDLGALYLEMGQLGEAETYLNKAHRLFSEMKVMSPLAVVYYQLYDLEYQKGDYVMAIDHLDNYYTLRDSLQNNELREKVIDIETKYQSELKDKEIVAQQLIIEQAENELQKKKRQNTLISIVSLSLLAVLISLWFLFKQRQKRKDQELLTLKRESQVKTLESLIEGEEKERLRIARELHDGVNGDLSAIKFKLNSLLEFNNNTIQEVVNMIDQSCQQVRAISHNLVPPSLQEFSLLEAVELFCQNLDAIHPQKIDFQFIGDSFKIPKNAEISLFRIVQELVNNSIKHAEATEINVQISCHEHLLNITVEDNGKGFDTSRNDHQGIGLKNIQSRVEYLNATLDVHSDEKVTSFNIEIDLNQLDDY
ncbi:sensor histidine kinase [Paucihalobacter sp.]|uniref:sensor histidine kinase n=1 Tax=Paucihalobacter sp. TaxID=2850405 RepID=UPI002FE03113